MERRNVRTSKTNYRTVVGGCIALVLLLCVWTYVTVESGVRLLLLVGIILTSVAAFFAGNTYLMRQTRRKLNKRRLQYEQLGNETDQVDQELHEMTDGRTLARRFQSTTIGAATGLVVTIGAAVWTGEDTIDAVSLAFFSLIVSAVCFLAGTYVQPWDLMTDSEDGGDA